MKIIIKTENRKMYIGGKAPIILSIFNCWKRLDKV